MQMESEDGRDVALKALQESVDKRLQEAERPSPKVLQAVVDVAWRFQFQEASRAEARQKLREALAPEFAKAKAEDNEV